MAGGPARSSYVDPALRLHSRSRRCDRPGGGRSRWRCHNEHHGGPEYHGSPGHDGELHRDLPGRGTGNGDRLRDVGLPRRHHRQRAVCVLHLQRGGNLHRHAHGHRRPWCVATATTTITVTPLPSVQFTASTVALIGQTVRFWPSWSTAPGETITSSTWAFGPDLVTVLGPPVRPTPDLHRPGHVRPGPLGDRQQGSHRRGARSEHPHPLAADCGVQRVSPLLRSWASRSSCPPSRATPTALSTTRTGTSTATASSTTRPGHVCAATFTTAGPHTVGLRVTDGDKSRPRPRGRRPSRTSEWLAPITPAGVTKRRTSGLDHREPFLNAQAVPGRPDGGLAQMAGARIEVLGVRAPKGSRILFRAGARSVP